MLTRLVDDDPDLLTEAERSKVMLKAKTMRSTACVEKHLKKRFDASVKLPRTRVVDSIGRWLSQVRACKRCERASEAKRAQGSPCSSAAPTPPLTPSPVRCGPASLPLTPPPQPPNPPVALGLQGPKH